MAVVDFSMAGLTGIQAAADRQLTEAQTIAQGASARLNSANARQQEFETAQLERYNELDQIAASRLAGLAQGRGSTDNPYEGVAGTAEDQDPNQSAAFQLEELANVYEMGGAASRAADFRVEAAKIREAEDKIRQNASLDQQRRLDNIIKGADIVSRTMGVARSEAEWEFQKGEVQAAMDNGAFVMEPEQWEQFRQMPYDPEIVGLLRERAISAKDQAQLDLDREKEARTAAQGLMTIANARDRNAIAAASLAERTFHNAATRKTAGANTQTATAAGDNDRDAVTNILLSGPLADFDKTDPEVINLSNEIAEEAKLILRDTPGINFTTAANRAIMQAQRSGRIKPAKTTGWLDLERDSATSIQGGSAETALPPPSDMARLQVGKFYKNRNGEVAQWDGVTMNPVD